MLLSLCIRSLFKFDFVTPIPLRSDVLYGEPGAPTINHKPAAHQSKTIVMIPLSNFFLPVELLSKTAPLPTVVDVPPDKDLVIYKKELIL